MSENTHIPPNEMAMQQAWRFQLWGKTTVTTVQGDKARVIDAGKLNAGPGPDFKDAKIKMGEKIWCGNIEIHRYASDWHRHGHDNDDAYRNTILHVVGVSDCTIQRKDGSEIPQIIMEIGSDFSYTFNNLLNGKNLVLPMCGHLLHKIAGIFKTDWITALAFERLNRKAYDINEILKSENGDWLQTTFITLARGLGFGTNADNMERLARSTPYKTLLKHTDDVTAVEAILLGQAGLLDSCHGDTDDTYHARLKNEYNFYKHKYGLRPIAAPLWQTSARTPANTPWRRIALLAAIVCTWNSDLPYKMFRTTDPEKFRSFFNISISPFWEKHYSFSKPLKNSMSPLGKQSLNLLLINVIAPLIFCRAINVDNHSLSDAAVNLWLNCPSEQNSIINGFIKHGIKSDDAFTSQALIQLHRIYCEKRRCPECRIGHRLLSENIKVN